MGMLKAMPAHLYFLAPWPWPGSKIIATSECLKFIMCTKFGDVASTFSAILQKDIHCVCVFLPLQVSSVL